MRFFSRLESSLHREPGNTLIEAVVVLAIMATVIVTFLSGLAATSKAAFAVDEMATAESIAQNQMEFVQSSNYTTGATQYPSSPILAERDYTDYSVNISAAALNVPGGSIQKITVIVKRSGEQIYRLESYKVDR